MTRSAFALLCLLLAGCPSAGGPTCAADGCPGDSGAWDGGGWDGGAWDGGGWDGDAGDGGAVDAGDGVVRLDWRVERGPALETRSSELGSEELFAVTSDGVVFRDACDGGACDFRWQQLDGGLPREGHRWRAPFPTSPVSPDGRTLLMLELQAQSSCALDGSALDQLDGDGLLVELETGATLATVPGYSTYAWGENHFTSAGAWFRLLPRADGGCGTTTEELRSTLPPYAPAPGFDPRLYVERELPDGRWLAVRDGLELGFVSPGTADSFQTIAPDMETHLEQGGWVHAFSRSPVRELLSVELPSGAPHRWTVPAAEEWYAQAAWGRWVVLHGRRDAQTRAWPYRVHDMLGQVADVDLALVSALPGDGLALLGALDLLVVTAPDAAGVTAARRLDLRTGAVDALSDRTMKLVPVGDGQAAVIYDDAGALLVERGPVSVLASGAVTEVYAMREPASSLPLPQRSLVLIVRPVETGQFALDAFNLDNRRLVTLTDRLAWAPRLAEGLTDVSCGRPWVTRSAGGGSQSLATPSRSLYFLEHPEGPGEASLFVGPLDLAAPPRLLTTLTPIYCSSPMVSPDGRHVAAAIDGYDTAPRRWLRDALLTP